MATGRSNKSRTSAGTSARSRGSSVRFRTTLNQAEGKSATGVLIPDSVIERLGHGRRPPVRVTINGHEYRTTVGVMGGQAMLGVSAAMREKIGLAAGDKIEVELTLDTTPREVKVPPDLAKALADDRGTREFFDGLSNSLQRYHVDNIETARSDQTRQRRIEKALGLFRAGKKR
jgi:hypothetical protein